MAAAASFDDEDYFWETDPSSLVNSRIAIENDTELTQSPEGLVTEWDPKDGMHLVRFGDGSKHWYHLKVTTFWVVDKDEETRLKFSPRPGAVKARYGPGNVPGKSAYASHAAADSTHAPAYNHFHADAYQRPWTPYQSPTPNAQTDCTFHVVLDPRAVQEGEHVALTGNLDAMGAWSQDGVPMSRHPHNPSLWSAMVTLPYTTYDVCTRGLFQFAYKVMTSCGEEIAEGGDVRVQNRLEPHFYHSFQHNNACPRFRGWSADVGKAPVQDLVRTLLHDLKLGAAAVPQDGGTVAGALARWAGICATGLGALREHVEDIFDLTIEKYSHEGEELSQEELMVLMGMVGQFGVTTSERIYTTVANHGYAYVHGKAAPTHTVVTYRKPSQPRPWCHFLVNRIDACFWFRVLRERDASRVGGKWQWLPMGLAECIERFSYNDYYDWLVLLPFAQLHPIQRPKIYDMTHLTNHGDLYLTAARRTLALAEAQSEVARAQTRASADSTNVYTQVGQEIESLEAQLARAWACAVLKHAPSVAVMNALLVHDWLKRMARDDLALAEVVATKVEGMAWRTPQDWLALEDLLDASPLWRSPSMATTLLKNTSMAQRPGQTLEAVVRCLEAAEKRRLQDFQKDDHAADVGGANELVGDWAVLNNAAKSWLRLQHEREPIEITASRTGEVFNQGLDDYGDWWTVGNKGRNGASKKKTIMTPRDVANRRVAGLADCCAHLNTLLRTAFFGRNNRGVLFELTRCWFLKGKPALVLEAICRVATQDDGLYTYCAPLVDFIVVEAKKLVVGLSSAEVAHSLEVVMELLPPIMPLAHDLLSTLASDITWPSSTSKTNYSGSQFAPESSPPPLESALVHHHMWAAVFKWCESGSALEGMNTVLVQLLNALKSFLATTAQLLMDDAVPLGTLGTLEGDESSRSYFALLGAFGVADPEEQRSILQALIARKQSFDDRFAKCQAFSSFFCVSAGIRIDATALRHIVDSTTKNYSALLSSQIHTGQEVRIPVPTAANATPMSTSKASAAGTFSSGAFVFGNNTSSLSSLSNKSTFVFGSTPPAGPTGVLDEIPEAIDWLYELRTSELFLALWRRAGKQVLEESIEGAEEFLRPGAAAHLDDEDDDEDEEEGAPALPPLPDGLDPQDGNAVQQWVEAQAAARRALVQTRTEARRTRAQARLERQDLEAKFVEELNTKVLSQDMVISLLLPRAKTQWQELARNTALGTLTTEDLDATFGKLRSEGQVSGEVRTLFSTTTGHFESLREALARLKDYDLLRKLGRWLPALLTLHDLLGPSLCTTSPDLDSFRATLTAHHDTIAGSAGTYTLESIPSVVEGMRSVFVSYSDATLDFLATLADCPALVKWLLAHGDQQEFNQMLTVVRPCTDEPRMLSAIASLVFVRTLLIDPLYNGPPYQDLTALMHAFRGANLTDRSRFDGDDPQWHLVNIVGTFDALEDVFEKQTKSPSIKSCYDLRDLASGGVFVLRPGANFNDTLVVLTGGGEQKDLEYLMDLRSKLLMAEVPAELEEEFGASLLIESFVQQLQVMNDTSAALQGLSSTGHPTYCQPTFTLEKAIAMDALPAMQHELKALELEASEWKEQVKASRNQHYYLNYFTMRDILRIRKLLENPSEVATDVPTEAFTDAVPVHVNSSPSEEVAATSNPDPADAASVADAAPADAGGGGGGVGDPAAAAELCTSEAKEGQGAEEADKATEASPPSEAGPELPTLTSSRSAEFEQVCAIGFPEDHAAAALRRCDNNVEAAVEFLFAYSQHMDRIVAEDTQKFGIDSSAARPASPGTQEMAALLPTPSEELTAMLHAVSSTVNEAAVPALMEHLRGRLESGADFLEALGVELSLLFGDFDCSVRNIPPPGAAAVRRADMLIPVDIDGKRGVPLFVTSTDAPEDVMDVTLSVFVRRGRVPEPGEVLFATVDTTAEDIDLLLRRWIAARSCGRSGHVFVVADLHVLSYAQQCHLVEQVRGLIAEWDTSNAATLLLVSGRPQQAAVNQLSQHYLDLPSLETSELQIGLAHAFRLHLGDTEAIASCINGGGKTHNIMRRVGDRQRAGEAIAYCRVPMRESTTAASLVSCLRNSTARCKAADANFTDGSMTSMMVHLDVGHIIPAGANNMLFELLLVGVVRDSTSSLFYHRNAAVGVFIELPNSPGNTSALALRFASLLPTTLLQVSAATMDVSYPVFTDPYATKIGLPAYEEALLVAKWLRAFRAGNFNPQRSTYAPDFDIFVDAPITSEEVYEELAAVCNSPTGPAPQPSFAAFRSLIMFLNIQFQQVQRYALLDGNMLASLGGGWPQFKHAFVRMMVETGKDFTLRSVSQAAGVGPPPPLVAASSETADELSHATAFGGPASDNAPFVFGLAAASEPPSSTSGAAGLSSDPLPPMRRHSSTSSTDEARRVSASAPSPMRRQTTLELASRFGNMRSWEASDHPIVLFKMSQHGDGNVEGVDLMSLNPSLVDRFVDRGLRGELEASGIDFAKDWHKLTNEECVQRLRDIQGLMDQGEGGRGGVRAMDVGYVLTVDNLLKMISILMRLRVSLPAIIMGETGCGKSSLIRNMCGILGFVLRTLNVHGGMIDEDIVAWTATEVDRANRMPHENLVVFFDEVNTCNCMGLFREIVCDRCLNGVPIPPNLKIIAACNPYRLRTALSSLYGHEEMAGLVFEQHERGLGENVGTGIKDPLRNLVYRVHPLPESMIDHIFDFGALSSSTEKLYIHAMIKHQLKSEITVHDDLEDGGEEDLQESGEASPGNAAAAAEARPAASVYSAWEATWVKKKSNFDEFVDVFTELICAAQECIRKLSGGERSAASLRDVRRCCAVFKFFGEHFDRNRIGSERWTLADFYALRPRARAVVRKALVLSLAFCYHARLPRTERGTLVQAICGSWRELQVTTTTRDASAAATSTYAYAGAGAGGLARATFGRSSLSSHRGWGHAVAGHVNHQASKCEWLQLEVTGFETTLHETQRHFTREFNVGERIALNEALCENLFMILVSTLNQIPIFVVGKPGSSKSLAMGLIQQNLNGSASDTPFLRSLPAVEVFPYQCSPLSNSAGIEQAFASAQRYRRESPGTVVVVLLDEVGLAEQSPHLPLKVLHKLLDEAGDNESVVGISNWTLDPAKMNRAVHLYRPAPTVEDLALTAEGMVKSANLKGYLGALAKAYSAVYHAQSHADFWGLREYYSTVRAINAAINQPSTTFHEGEGGGTGQAMASSLSAKHPDGNLASALDASMLLNAVLRNFGGRPAEMEAIVSVFFDELRLPLPSVASWPWAETLVRANLREPSARHLMLLTKNNGALPLVFDRGTLSHHTTEVIFGSDFPLDQTDLQIVLDIQRVKLCMAAGTTVVLVHCESLYESLYDLLNQHYSSYGGQSYVRLAFGTHSRLCPIHPDFRVVVIVEKVDAYERLAPPLLNRFEKQVLERSDVLEAKDRILLERLKDWANRFAGGDSESWRQVGKRSGGATLTALRATFCGWHSDFLSSLLLATRARLESASLSSSSSSTLSDQPLKTELVESAAADEGSLAAAPAVAAAEDREERELLATCWEQLLWLACPERVCRVLAQAELAAAFKDEVGLDLRDVYFERQQHSSLPVFANTMLEEWTADGVGACTMVATHSPLASDVTHELTAECPWLQVTHVVLHELDQERDLRQQVDDFFKGAQDGAVLVVQCDPLGTGTRRLEHAKNILEKARAKFVLQQVEDKDKEQSVEHEASRSEIDAAKEANTGAAEVDDVNAAAQEASLEETTDALTTQAEDVEEAVSTTTSANSQQTRRGIHVVMLLHLPRGATNKWCASYDLRWRLAFVDGVHAANNIGLPPVQDMIGKSMSEVVAELEMKKVLTASFRSALAMLQYPSERNNLQVREQIAHLLSLMDQPFFVDFLTELVSEMIQKSKSNALDEASGTRDDESALVRSGTFQGALHGRVIGAVSSTLAIALSHGDRNHMLRLLAEESLQDLWKRLFLESFRQMQVFETASAKKNTRQRSGQLKMGEMVSVVSDGYQGSPFSAEFPFSFFLDRHFSSMRSLSEGTSEEALDKQFAVLNLGLDGHLEDETLLERYTRDLCCMHFKAVDGMPPDIQATLLLRLLEVHGRERPQTLAALHFRLWSAEQEAHILFALLSAVPQAHTPVVDLLQSPSIVEMNTGERLLAVLAAVTAALDPDANFGDEWENSRAGYLGWLASLEAARPLFAALLALASRSMDGEDNDVIAAVATRWAAVGLVSLFVRTIALPLALLPNTVFMLAEAARAYPLQSVELLRAVLASAGAALELDLVGKGAEDEPSADVGHFTEQCCLDYFIGDGASEELLEDLTAIACCRVPAALASTVRLGVLPGPSGRIALLRELRSRASPAVSTTLAAALVEDIQTAGFCDTPLAVAFVSVTEEALDSRTSNDTLTLPDLDLLHLLVEPAQVNADNVLPLLETTAQARRLFVHFAAKRAAAVPGGGEGDSAPEAEAAAEQCVPLLVDSARSEHAGLIRSMRVFVLKQVTRRVGASVLRGLLQGPMSALPWVAQWRDAPSADTNFLRFLGQNALPRMHPLKTLPGFELTHAEVARYVQDGNLPALAASLGGFARQATALPGMMGTFKAALLASLFFDVLLLNVLPRVDALAARSAELIAWINSHPAELSCCSPPDIALLALFAGGGGAVHVHVLRLDPSSSPESVIQAQLLAHLAASCLAAAPGSQLALFQALALNPSELHGSWLPTMPEDALKMAQSALGGRWYRCPQGHPFYVDHCGRPTQVNRCAECGEQIGGLNHDLLANNEDIGNVGTGYHQRTEMEDNSPVGYSLRDADAESDQYHSVRKLSAISLRAMRYFLHGSMMLGMCAMGETAWGTQAAALINPQFVRAGVSASVYMSAHLESAWTLLKELLDKSADDLSVLLHQTLLDATSSTASAPAVATTPAGCDATCSQRHSGHGNCLVCGLDWGHHSGHKCKDGRRGSWPMDASGAAEDEDQPPPMRRQGAAEESSRSGSQAAAALEPVLGAPGTVVLTLKARNSWETALDRVLSPVLSAKDLDAQVTQASALFCSADLGQGLDGELAERHSSEALSAEARAQSSLALWHYRRPFELSHFTGALQRLSSNVSDSSPFPVLATFFEHESKLKALAHLPKVLEWIALLRSRFNRKMDRETARKTTIGSILENLSPQERPLWEAAFDGFAAAWNANWKFVERFECLVVPKEYAGVGMSREEFVSFCLPCDTDEGICSLALVQHLRTEHNALVAAVDERSVTSQRAKRAAARTKGASRKSAAQGGGTGFEAIRRDGVGTVSSRHLTDAHVLTYDLSALVRYISLQCVDSSSSSGSGSYDFTKAEARLVERHLQHLPVLDLELPAFTFAHEQHLSGGLAPLRAKVAQEPLSRDIQEALKREFQGQPAAAHHLLGTLETVVAFLAATGGSLATSIEVGEVLLEDYLRDTLMLVTYELALGRAVAAHVRLKHVAALWEFLEACSGLDPFAKVSVKFKEPMSPEQTAELEEFVGSNLSAEGHEREMLRDELRKFIAEMLVEESLAAGMPIVDVLGHVTVNDENLNDLEWFNAFPNSVPLACAVEAYRVIEALV